MKEGTPKNNDKDLEDGGRLKEKEKEVIAMYAQLVEINGEEIAKMILKEEKILLAFELLKNGEVFPFPGLRLGLHDDIATAQAEELEMLGYTCTAPIDELLQRFEKEGFKITLGQYPESGNVLILPSGSDDVENDSLLLRNLSFNGDADERLLELFSKVQL